MTEKPKRPMSAYLLWLNATRSKIKEDHPGLKVTDVAKKAGELWRAMDDKSEWEEKAAKAKEQYAKDLESFNANGGGGAAGKKGQKRGKSKPTRGTKAKVKKEVVDDEDEEEEDVGDSE